MRAAFERIFADDQLLPPLQQLMRGTVLLTPAEAASYWGSATAAGGRLMNIASVTICLPTV
ncbi:DUF4132 domain-containing protein [Klebsiella oxytoca]|uniref:DUF4132 domain-containing protein n=1 Tax=Klebsiella oxytoca TaxID=571 RepID=UPI0022287E37|nr:DUF4132 domain-containing protein [Klebsiella oxytoca]